MNHKRKKPRTRSYSSKAFPKEAPAFWNIIRHSRPRCRRTRFSLWKVMNGWDADALVWDTGNHKPHIYYW